ncbi:hypothetical protein, partial [Escherichia coli]|uniref:hypothetical protein n=1 Tax=Escherichia coli TaxID=562 RepID=UPI003C76766C
EERQREKTNKKSIFIKEKRIGRNKKQHHTSTDYNNNNNFIKLTHCQQDGICVYLKKKEKREKNYNFILIYCLQI